MAPLLAKLGEETTRRQALEPEIGSLDALAGPADFASAAVRRALLRQASRIRQALLDHRDEARDVPRAFVPGITFTPYGSSRGRRYTFETTGTYGALFGETRRLDGVPDGTGHLYPSVLWSAGRLTRGRLGPCSGSNKLAKGDWSMRKAVIYETTPAGSNIVGRIRIVDGRLVGEPPDDPSIRFILGCTARRADGTLVSTDDDPEAFLAALPSAYTGAMLRVGLEGDARLVILRLD